MKTSRSPIAISASVVAVAALSISTLAACGSSSETTNGSKITVRGVVLLHDLQSARSAALLGVNKTTPGCKGLGAYSKVDPGGDVVISDDAGKTLAIAKLKGGYIVDDQATTCRFTFTASVDGGNDYYGVDAGAGSKKISRAGMKSGPTVDVGNS